MPDHTQIYQSEADMYERLISRQPSLAGVIDAICPYAGADVIDLGAGTGRLTLPLAEKARSVTALDASEAMLEVISAKASAAGLHQVKVQVADHRQLPLSDECADLVVAGWTICYLASMNHPEWRNNLKAVLSELRRILRPGGTAIIFETLGTGFTTPHPPDFLKDYYKALEEEHGFAHQWIRLDYSFHSIEEALQLSQFFFGDELAEQVMANQWTTLPECAGIWSLRKL